MANEMRVGWPNNNALKARNRGMCKNCKLLDTSTRQEFPDGNIMVGCCVAHPVQPNGKWNDDYCDMIQHAVNQELNEWGESIGEFVFAAKEVEDV
jgi:hypothetical protein